MTARQLLIQRGQEKQEGRSHGVLGLRFRSLMGSHRVSALNVKSRPRFRGGRWQAVRTGSVVVGPSRRTVRRRQFLGRVGVRGGQDAFQAACLPVASGTLAVRQPAGALCSSGQEAPGPSCGRTRPHSWLRRPVLWNGLAPPAAGSGEQADGGRRSQTRNETASCATSQTRHAVVGSETARGPPAWPSLPNSRSLRRWAWLQSLLDTRLPGVVV